MSNFRRRLIMQEFKSKVNIIYINQTIDDPTKMITGDINGNIIQFIRKNSHRVLAKKTGEGTITYAVLDDNNSNKYYDGSEAKTDGTEGDVFVKLPTFYYRGNDDGPNGSSGDNVKIKFSKEPFEDSIEWDTNILIGAYKAYNENGKLYSKSDVVSSGYTPQYGFKSYAQARGEGYQLVDWQMHCILCCLFYAMYGNTNSQAICGVGIDSSSGVLGRTNSLGMNDTKIEINENMFINFWGLEGWWGNKYEYMQENSIGKIMNTYDPLTKGLRTINIPNVKDVFPKKMIFGKYLDIIVRDDDPKDGNDLVGYCDTQSWDNSQVNNVIYRSCNNSISDGGVSFIYEVEDFALSYCGSRLAFRGICTEETNITTFKNLPVL